MEEDEAGGWRWGEVVRGEGEMSLKRLAEKRRWEWARMVRRVRAERVDAGCVAAQMLQTVQTAMPSLWTRREVLCSTSFLLPAVRCREEKYGKEGTAELDASQRREASTQL